MNLIYGLTVVELCAPMNYIMDRLLHVHYNLLQKTFTYERVLCDLSLFLYYKLHVTVHLGYILSTCINILLVHHISWYISVHVPYNSMSKKNRFTKAISLCSESRIRFVVINSSRGRSTNWNVLASLLTAGWVTSCKTNRYLIGKLLKHELSRGD